VRDYGATYTENELKALERKISSVYSEAVRDMERKLADFTQKFQAKDAIHLKELADGKITKADYKDWVAGQVFQGKQWTTKRNQLAATLSNANAEALKIINGGKISVFAENMNWAAFQLEHTAGVNFGFNLYDSTAVTRMLRDDPHVLPFKKLDRAKDQRWNFKNIKSQLTQGMIQGENIDQIADRLAKVTGSRNRNQMLTAARTAMTSAQNGGRLERLKEAEAKGIKCHKEWIATLDEHTRDTHQKLDGQKQLPSVPFKVDGYEIDFPGDPHAHPSLVYNCRCALAGDIDDYPAQYQRYDNIAGKPIDNMTYTEWKKAKGTDDQTPNIMFTSGAAAESYFGVRPSRQLRKENKEEYRRQLEEYKTETAYGRWEESLTDDEKRSIGEYSGDAYAGVNGLLRHQMTDKMVDGWNATTPLTIEDMINNLDSAISKFELRDNLTVYRTCESDVLQTLKLNPGSMFHDDGFGSTSVLQNKVASGNIVMEINVPAGTGNGAWINPLSGAADEEWEFLLPRGSNYIVKDVENRGET